MKKADKPSLIKSLSVSSLRRISKVFIVNNHSATLEAFEARLAKIIELGTCRKIVVVKMKPNGPAQSFDDVRLVRQIVEGMEKSRKQIEGIWRTLKRDLESDIWKQWMDTLEESKRLKEKMSKEQTKSKEPKETKLTKKETDQTIGDTAREPGVPRRPTPPPGYLPTDTGDDETEQQEEEEEEEEEEIHRPILIPKLIDYADMQVLLDELRNHDMSIADFYTVVFCKSPTVMIKDLLQLGIAISAIIHFVPCPVSELELHFPDIYSDIQEFKKCDETKPIGLFVSTLNIDLLTDFNPLDLYEQFKNYLFDIEMLSQHFLIYQREFLEINDAMTSKENLVRAFKVHFSKEASDITAVCVYFDNLCRMVENATKYDRRYSSFHPRPFIDNDYGKIIVEDGNELLKSAIATEMNLVTYWRAVDMVINSLRRNHSVSPVLLDRIKLPLHKEILSWESFAQRLESVKLQYDHCTRLDLTDKCKLFSVHRTLYKIMETKTKMHLPTKLCFRDFCNFKAPEYVHALRLRMEPYAYLLHDKERADDDEESTDTYVNSDLDYNKNRNPLFSGLTFDDTYQELTVSEKTYRFHPMGYVRVKSDNWLYKERKLTVEIGLFKCLMYTHLWDDFALPLVKKVRIISKHGVSINVELFENDPQPSIYIQWPNDCQIRYISEDGVFAVEQRYYWETGAEYKRIYTHNGCVLVYMNNDMINVLTPNGIYYNLFPINYTDPNEPDEKYKLHRPLTSVDISEELAFVKRLTDYGIDCEYFDVTKTDGRKIRVLHGVPIEEKAKYLMYEWMDLGYSELFGERDDGIKLIFSLEGLKTYYPCGTMIHTVTTDDYVEVGLDCRSQSTENILRKINPDIIRRLDERRIQRQIFVNYELTYHIKHERFASITCYEDKRMIIKSPDQVKVAVSGDPNERLIVIDVGNKVSIRFMQDVCNITSAIDKDMSIKLNLIPNDDEILVYEDYHAKVVLKENGQFINEAGREPIDPKEEELYFLTKPYKFGIAFLPDSEIKDIVNANKNNEFFYQTPKKLVLFKKIQPINVRFSMPMPEMQLNLNKLYLSQCRSTFRELKYQDSVFAARTILHADRPLKNLCDHITKLTYVDYSLSDNIQDALDYWFLPKSSKSKYSPLWKKKIRETTRAMRENKKRAPIYRAMMQYKVFPKYHEYMKAGKNVDKLNVNFLMPELLKKGFEG